MGKTLKKTLSFLLALIMVFSLCGFATTGAYAETIPTYNVTVTVNSYSYNAYNNIGGQTVTLTAADGTVYTATASSNLTSYGVASFKVPAGEYTASARFVGSGNSSTYSGSKKLTVTAGENDSVTVFVSSEGYTMLNAEQTYANKTTFDHIDIRVNGTVTIEHYVNGVLSSSEEKAVVVSNPSVVVKNSTGGVRYSLNTSNASESNSHEWRWTRVPGTRNRLSVAKTDTVTLTCDITIGGVTQENQTFTFSGYDAFVLAIFNCDGKSGLDFNVTEKDIEESFFYNVTYEWTDAPSSAVLPTDLNQYSPNGTVTLNTTYKKGDTITVGDDVYTFSGWTSYTPAGGVNTALADGATSFTITKNTTVYGKWTKATKYNYTLTYDGNGGTLSGGDTSYNDTDGFSNTTATTVNYTVDVNTFARANYTFLGWADSATGSVVYAPDDEIALTSAANTKTIYAVWSENAKYDYTLTYDGNGGTLSGGDTSYNDTEGFSGVYDTSKSYTVDGNTFVRANYTFLGWADSATGSVVYAPDDEIALTSDVNTKTIYAVWSENAKYDYTLTYDGNGGTLSGGDTSYNDTEGFSGVYDTSKSYTVDGNTFVRANYTFLGWADSATGSVVYAPGAPVILTSDASTKTLYAVWSENDKYSVTYAYVSGTPSMALPSEISTASGAYAVSDANTYYVDETVTRVNPASARYEIKDSDGAVTGYWTLTGWDKPSAKMTAAGVTFTGTWTYTATDVKENAASFTVNKVDQDGNALAGASFALTNGTDAVGTLTKSEDGTMFTFSGLTAGTYTLTETAPAGYTGAGPWTVTVSKAVGADGLPVVTITGPTDTSNVVNKVWDWIVSAVTGGSDTNLISSGAMTVKNEMKTETVVNDCIIPITKIDGSDESALAGAVFTLYSDSDCKTAIGTYTSDANGIITITSGDEGIKGIVSAMKNDDTVGVYLKETTAPDGYKVDSTVRTITLIVKDSVPKLDTEKNVYVITRNYTYAIFTKDLEIVNDKNLIPETVDNSVTVIKTDADGKRLAGAVFTLYSDNDCKTAIGTYTSDAEGKLTISTADSAIATAMSATPAVLKLYLKETTAPTGYKAGDTVWTVNLGTSTADPALKADKSGFAVVTTNTISIAEAENGTLTVPNEANEGTLVINYFIDDSTYDTAKHTGTEVSKTVTLTAADGKGYDTDKGTHTFDGFTQIRVVGSTTGNIKGDETIYVDYLYKKTIAVTITHEYYHTTNGTNSTKDGSQTTTINSYDGEVVDLSGHLATSYKNNSYNVKTYDPSQKVTIKASGNTITITYIRNISDNSPKTGDSSTPLVVILAVLALSAGGFGMAYFRKPKKHED